MITRLVILFTNHQDLLKTIQNLNHENIKISNVYSPYPIHGIDQALGIKRSILPVIAFISGSAGAFLAFYFQQWTHTVAWPMNIGGKPNLAIPSFIPITFEGMVLIGAISMIAFFLLINKLLPRFQVETIAHRTTHDRFAITIDPVYNAINVQELKKILKNPTPHLILEKDITYEKLSL